jgi:radical SAM superfamily enzyme YgiQ (UPF0313 family)
MANLGLHALYAAVNTTEGMLCDLFFVEPDTRRKPLSLERGLPPTEFDLLAFTVHFEPDYPGVARFLFEAGLEPLSARRTDGDPFVVAGGPSVSANPEPLADFLDFVFVGEYEGGGADALSKIRRINSLGLSRKDALPAVSEAPHVYVPGLASFSFDGPQTALFRYKGNSALPIAAARPSLSNLDPAATAIRTNRAEFSDMHLVEFARGCLCGCRFCMAGFTARPFRSFDTNRVIAAATKPGVRKKVGAVGELFVGHPEFGRVLSALEAAGRRVSPSSVRTEYLDIPTVESLVRSGMKTLTLAPETPSERLSRAINKEFDRERFISVVETAVAAGIETIKLYFMVGLPGEVDDDAHEIARLAHEVRPIVTKARKRTRLGALSLSIGAFVPKPWTPLQWAAMETPEVLDRRRKIIAAALKGVSNVESRFASSDEALFEAILARADRRASTLILDAANRGWRAALRTPHSALRTPDWLAFAMRPRDPGEVFPWEVVTHGCTRGYLWAEYEKFLGSKWTPPCNTATCRACGACV